VITVSGLSKAFGAKVLFRDVTITLVPGRRTALVGNNGAGKTTLIEILMGEQQPDSGEVHRPKDTRIGFLPQELTEVHQGTVLETVLSGAAEVAELEHRLAELAQRIATTTGAEHDKVMEQYGNAQHRFETLGGYGVEAEAHAILAGLGFDPNDSGRPIREMSGGWRMRAALGRLLLSKPEVLILDEPTNHLDTDSVTWLEDTLKTYPGAVFFVSHDRDFIDNVADRVVELAFQTATEYVGGFAEFVVEREERLARLESLRSQQQKEVAKIEQFIERFRYKATKARQAQSRIKTLEKLERIEVPTQKELVVKFGFPEPRRSGREVAEMEGITLGYDGVPLLKNVDLVIERGQKVGIVGPNGAGKTTLIKLLLGQLKPMAGKWQLGSNVDIATFAQHQVEGLDFECTPIQELQKVARADERRNLRTVLGSFGFSGEAAERAIGDLSGGERTRLALAKALLNPVNLLILDEPTNHLDLASCDLLEDALRAYPGTVLLVSHDRYLIREVCDALVSVRNGNVRLHIGVDDAVLSPRTAGSSNSFGSSSGGSKGSSSSSGSGAKAQPQVADKRTDAERRNARHVATRDLVKKVEKLERELGLAEADVAKLQRQLADPTVYADNEKVKTLVDQHEKAKAKAAELSDAWLAAGEKLEQTEKRFPI
jgi:ATP-binding cassette, subfamily F, member 3